MLIIKMEYKVRNFRFPLFFSKKPNRKVGLFYFKSLKIKSVFLGRSKSNDICYSQKNPLFSIFPYFCRVIYNS